MLYGFTPAQFLVYQIVSDLKSGPGGDPDTTHGQVELTQTYFNHGDKYEPDV